jgi:hypothetical protein
MNPTTARSAAQLLEVRPTRPSSGRTNGLFFSSTGDGSVSLAVDQRPREPTLADLAAAVRGYMTVDPAMVARAAAGRAAITSGADPLLTLGLVVWPSEKVTAAQASTRMAAGSG